MITSAKSVILKCGGHETVADWLGVTVTTTYRWTYTREAGGTGGIIPAQYQGTLLRIALENGIDLEPADFFPPVEGKVA